MVRSCPSSAMALVFSALKAWRPKWRWWALGGLVALAVSHNFVQVPLAQCPAHRAHHFQGCDTAVWRPNRRSGASWVPLALSAVNIVTRIVARGWRAMWVPVFLGSAGHGESAVVGTGRPCGLGSVPRSSVGQAWGRTVGVSFCLLLGWGRRLSWGFRAPVERTSG